MTVVSPVISLPNSQSAAALQTSQPIQRQYATLPRKGNNNVVIGGTLGRSPAPMPPRRDPKTTLSVGRARARSMVAGLGNGLEFDVQIRDVRVTFTKCLMCLLRFLQKAAAKGMIAMRSRRPAPSRAARNRFTCRSNRRPERTPVRTLPCNRERPVFDRVQLPAGSPPRNSK